MDFFALREQYAGKTDDELMLLACESAALTDEAKRLLTEELAKRGLGPRDVGQYSEHMAQAEAKESKRISRSRWLLRLTGFGFLARLLPRRPPK